MKTKSIVKILAPAALSLLVFNAQARDWIDTGGETYGEPVKKELMGFVAPPEMRTERLSTFTGGETYPEVAGEFDPHDNVGRVKSAVLTKQQTKRLYIN